MGQSMRFKMWMTCVAAAAFVLLGVGEASAEDMAGLKFETGSIDGELEEQLQSSMKSAFDSVERWSLIDFSSARGKMTPLTRDCFTKDCLTKAGEATGAAAGMSVELSGEAEIYEWTVNVWDLRSGKKLTSEQGNCELCGRAEVQRTFESSIKSILAATALPERRRARRSEKPAAADQTDEADATSSDGVELRISVVPSDAQIRINDQRAGEGKVERTIGPGSHEVQFRKEGYRGLNETVVIDENSDAPVVLRVHLSKTDPDAVRVPVGEGPIDRLGPKRTTYGWIGAGSGAVLLATGIVLTSMDGEAACGDGRPITECEEIYATGGAGMTLGVVGTALLTGGVTLLSWDLLGGDYDDPAADSVEEPATMSISPAVTSDSGGLLLRGQF
ncbi:MAG: PEGA domain-containing protein [Persicimonas sp.]